MAQPTSRKLVNVEPDKYNQKIINRYNQCHKRTDIYPENRKTKDFTAIFGVTANSMMSNQDIEISFMKKRIGNPIYNDKEDRVFFIQIKNKTGQTVYIDRGSCFRIDSDGSRYCYYDPSRRVDSLFRERVLVIPPQGQKILTDYHWIKNKEGNYVEMVEYPEEFLWNMEAVGICEGYVNYHESRLFTEKTSPFYRTFEISYSKDEDFSTYSLARVNCYIKEIIGYYYPEIFQYSRNNNLLVGDDEYSIVTWQPLY